MNEIEEYLLMIFMENDSYISKSRFDYCLDGKSHHWEQFKKEELERTLPEEFEFYISDSSLTKMKESKISCVSLDKEKDSYSIHKIKITVVEDD